ncbi:MAG TPA: hypothetical protein EYP36_13015 [Calditrichaeota bacterium]|nr:hypothetical protein [Calditrichota bacterium]
MQHIIDQIDAAINSIFDRLQRVWEGSFSRTVIGYLLVFTFVTALLFIEANRLGYVPAPLSAKLPTNHFYAISLVFTMLLIVEVISLVFSLVHSVANSVGKQMEILSLILLRQSFKEFIYFSEPIQWEGFNEPVYHILSDALGALLIFIVLGFYYRYQYHISIAKDEDDKRRFITAKKLVALLLLCTFTFVGVWALYESIAGSYRIEFFPVFYTILIFSDILIVLISMRYSNRYCILFRNSGFALTTVVIRLALTAPAYVNVALGLAAALFALGLTLAYNTFVPVLDKRK